MCSKRIPVGYVAAEAEANREKSQSITDELIKMTEAEARKKHGWIAVQGADSVIADSRE